MQRSALSGVWGCPSVSGAGPRVDRGAGLWPLGGGSRVKVVLAGLSCPLTKGQAPQRQ